MTKHSLSLFLSLAVVSLGAPATAQMEMPKPAPELQKFAPLIGNWQGSGTAMMGGPAASKWESHSSYTWTLGNFFVQEDTIVKFEDMPRPMVMRNYFGWDAARQCCVAVGANNDGMVTINRVDFVDGAMVQMQHGVQGGQAYLERITAKVAGDQMTFGIDMLMGTMPALEGVRGTMKRVDKAAPMALDASAFSSQPNPEIQRLAKTAGNWAVKATMTMMPGAPQMNITGRDQVESLFDGNLVHVLTSGVAEGMDDKYEGHVFYGYDEASRTIRAVFVSNMGEVGDMSGTFTADHKAFILTSAAPYMGQASAQRMVMNLDDNGAPVAASGHTLLGTGASYESWSATYSRQK